MISHFILKKLLTYNPLTGIFIWKSTNKIAGTLTSSGYISIKILGKSYPASRLAWFYMTGYWPEFLVDHHNTIRNDNSWINLRVATQSQNNANSRLAKNNTTGYKGITWEVKKRKFRAKIVVNKRTIHLGYFLNKEEAYKVYCHAAKENYGEFARI